MASPGIPAVDCREIGTKPVAITATGWTTMTSASFKSMKTGSALDAGLKLVVVIVNNTGSTGSIWVTFRSGLTSETPSAVDGAVEVVAGQSVTLGVYGTDATTVAYAGDTGAVGAIVTTFYPY